MQSSVNIFRTEFGYMDFRILQTNHYSLTTTILHFLIFEILCDFFNHLLPEFFIEQNIEVSRCLKLHICLPQVCNHIELLHQPLALALPLVFRMHSETADVEVRTVHQFQVELVRLVHLLHAPAEVGVALAPELRHEQHGIAHLAQLLLDLVLGALQRLRMHHLRRHEVQHGHNLPLLPQNQTDSASGVEVQEDDEEVFHHVEPLLVELGGRVEFASLVILVVQLVVDDPVRERVWDGIHPCE